MIVVYAKRDKVKTKQMKLEEEKEIVVQEKIVDIAEALQAVAKPLWIGLVAVIVLSYPLNLILKFGFSQLLVSTYSPPPIIYVAPVPEDLRIVDQDIFSLEEGDRYFAFARIANPNSDLAVRNLNYKFILRDRKGDSIRTFSGSSYILPGQDKLIFMPVVTVAGDPVAVDVILTPERWSRFSTLQSLDLKFENTNFGQDGSQFFASSILRNESPFKISEIEIDVILYDIQQNIIGVNFTTINEVRRQEGRFFRVVWPSGIDGSLASNIEFRPAINQFDRDVLGIESVEPEEQFGR